MTRYEQDMYGRDIPQIREALQEISKTLKQIVTIISDPGDEVEHIYSKRKENYEKIFKTNYPAKMEDIWKDKKHDVYNHDDMD